MERPIESSSNFRNSFNEPEAIISPTYVNSDSSQRNLSMLKLFRIQKPPKSLVNETKTEATILDTKTDISKRIDCGKSTKGDKDDEYSKALKQKLLDCLEIVACEYGANSEEVAKKDAHVEGNNYYYNYLNICVNITILILAVNVLMEKQY